MRYEMVSTQIFVKTTDKINKQGYYEHVNKYLEDRSKTQAVNLKYFYVSFKRTKEVIP